MDELDAGAGRLVVGPCTVWRHTTVACMAEQDVERVSRCGCRRSLFRNRVGGICCLFDKPTYSDMSACVCLCAVEVPQDQVKGARDMARGEHSVRH